MQNHERRDLLDRVNRSSATVGGSIPETVRIDGETVPLQEFYFDVADAETLDSEERARVESLLKHLRRERLQLVQRIRNDEVDYATGEELVPDILELERAIDALESLDEPDLAEQLRQERISSARELIEMLRSAGKT